MVVHVLSQSVQSNMLEKLPEHDVSEMGRRFDMVRGLFRLGMNTILAWRQEQKRVGETACVQPVTTLPRKQIAD